MTNFVHDYSCLSKRFSCIFKITQEFQCLTDDHRMSNKYFGVEDNSGQLTEIEKSSEMSAQEITEVVRTLRREGLYQGYLLRYSQDEEFKKFLLKTSGMPIIYADPIDAEFGIGMSAFDFVQWTMANNIIPQKSQSDR
ncbi:N-glycosidase [Trichinella spiralis]|uniref:N-glycosidase n=2 Tax=Trichinella spiralis TaxID=6334 RepID=A0ABR3KU36_TRISP